MRDEVRHVLTHAEQLAAAEAADAQLAGGSGSDTVEVRVTAVSTAMCPLCQASFVWSGMLEIVAAAGELHVYPPGGSGELRDFARA